MPLQNRVDPFGAIHAVAARGTFTGNRGVIHDPATRTLLRRRWSSRAWLICLCEFGDRRRDVMGFNGRSGGAGWTELFFLDEVTALAAGHRPCFYCRRERAKAFAAAYGDAFGIGRSRASDLDRRLHRERIASGGKPRPVAADETARLPDGAMVAAGDRAYAVRQGKLLPWSFGGYRPARAPADVGPLYLLTPATTVAVLRHGYRPAWHASAIEAA